MLNSPVSSSWFAVVSVRRRVNSIIFRVLLPFLSSPFPFVYSLLHPSFTRGFLSFCCFNNSPSLRAFLPGPFAIPLLHLSLINYYCFLLRLPFVSKEKANGAGPLSSLSLPLQGIFPLARVFFYVLFSYLTISLLPFVYFFLRVSLSNRSFKKAPFYPSSSTSYFLSLLHYSSLPSSGCLLTLGHRSTKKHETPSRKKDKNGIFPKLTLPRSHFLFVHDPQTALRSLNQTSVVRHHHHSTVELHKA